MEFPGLPMADPMAGLTLVPGAVEFLGHEPELDNELAGQIRRLGLAALLLPQPDQGGLVTAHDDAGVGAADEMLAIGECGQCLRQVLNEHRGVLQGQGLVSNLAALRGELERWGLYQ